MCPAPRYSALHGLARPPSTAWRPPVPQFRPVALSLENSRPLCSVGSLPHPRRAPSPTSSPISLGAEPGSDLPSLPVPGAL